MYSILRKELRFRLSSMFWWFIGMFGMALMVVAVFPSMASELQGMEMPAFFQMFGPVAEIYTLEGFLSVELFGFMVPLVVCIYGVVLGSNLLGGEEDEGTLEILMALLGAPLEDCDWQSRCPGDSNGCANLGNALGRHCRSRVYQGRFDDNDCDTLAASRCPLWLVAIARFCLPWLMAGGLFANALGRLIGRRNVGSRGLFRG